MTLNKKESPKNKRQSPLIMKTALEMASSFYSYQLF